MERPNPALPLPMPLFVAVVLLLATLVIVKVRAARARRNRDGRSPTVGTPSSPRPDLPRDPAAALEALKREGSRRDG